MADSKSVYLDQLTRYLESLISTGRITRDEAAGYWANASDLPDYTQDPNYDMVQDFISFENYQNRYDTRRYIYGAYQDRTAAEAQRIAAEAGAKVTPAAQTAYGAVAQKYMPSQDEVMRIYQEQQTQLGEVDPMEAWWSTVQAAAYQANVGNQIEATERALGKIGDYRSGLDPDPNDYWYEYWSNPDLYMNPDVPVPDPNLRSPETFTDEEAELQKRLAELQGEQAGFKPVTVGAPPAAPNYDDIIARETFRTASGLSAAQRGENPSQFDPWTRWITY